MIREYFEKLWEIKELMPKIKIRKYKLGDIILASWFGYSAIVISVTGAYFSMSMTNSSVIYPNYPWNIWLGLFFLLALSGLIYREYWSKVKVTKNAPAILLRPFPFFDVK